MSLHTALAAAAAATLLLTVPAHANTPTAAHRAAGEVVTTTLYEAIDALPVADEDRTVRAHRVPALDRRG
ncbi:hypothetical protein [Kitasatospora sp. NPDC085879]|uniref:hypothetical protein n=1 Tax=Kitasatospora sp. NPDC085879 TaxID=3154769 RepID=UPI003442CB2B